MFDKLVNFTVSVVKGIIAIALYVIAFIERVLFELVKGFLSTLPTRLALAGLTIALMFVSLSLAALFMLYVTIVLVGGNDNRGVILSLLDALETGDVSEHGFALFAIVILPLALVAPILILEVGLVIIACYFIGEFTQTQKA